MPATYANICLLSISDNSEESQLPNQCHTHYRTPQAKKNGIAKSRFNIMYYADNIQSDSSFKSPTIASPMASPIFMYVFAFPP